jgi:UDPglucose 6-dehydrogenase
VTVCDPEAMPNARHILGDRVRYVADAEAALMNADMGVVLTEWPVFQRLDMARVGEAMKHPLIVDMRGLWSLAHMRELGFVYVPIGIAV